MEGTKIICRLCLNFTNCDESQVLDNVSKDMLQFILPQVNLNITHDPKICQACYKSVLSCYRFKSTCNKDVNSEAKKDSSSRESETISIQDEELEKKCNFCSSSRVDESSEEFNDRKTYFVEILQKCLPEWNLSTKTVPCKKCLDILTSQFTFIGNCADTEDKLKHYCLTQGTNSEGKLNLYEAVRHILSKENKNVASTANELVFCDESVENVNIAENDSLREANDDVPFPEVEVNTRVLKTEEVDIKPEALDEEFMESERLDEPGGSGSVPSQLQSWPLAKRHCTENIQGHSSNSTESNIEKPSSTSLKQHKPLIEDVFEHDRYQIRRIVHSFFMRREQPSLKSIQAVLQKDGRLPPLSNYQLIRILHKINFRMRGRRHSKFLKEKDQTIIWRRRYLTQIKEYRVERPVYYLDEMFMYIEQDTNVKSFTIFHIGNEEGFLEDGLVVFESKTPEDYNKKFKITMFEEWFKKILPKLKYNAVIVLHHAPCSSRTLDQFPTMATHKVDIKKWLSSKGIVFEPDMVKLELLDLARRAKPLIKPYVVEEIAKARRKTVLRMPPYHKELSPLQSIWPKIRSEIPSKCSSCDFEKVRACVVDAIARVSKEDWEKAINDVLNVEKELWQLDFIMEQHMETFLVNYCSSNESESDSE